MKTSACAFVVILLLGALWSDRALTSTTYTDSLGGNIIPPGSSSLSIEADASGALPGRLGLSLQVNGTTVAGGRWWLSVRQGNPDGTFTEVGTLMGQVSGGTVSRAADGSIVSLNSLTLTIQHGTGNFATTTGGSGTAAGTINRQNTPPFTGSLSLTF